MEDDVSEERTLFTSLEDAKCFMKSEIENEKANNDWVSQAVESKDDGDSGYEITENDDGLTIIDNFSRMTLQIYIETRKIYEYED